MKKKILVLLMLAIGILGFTACGNTKVNLADYLIENRENLFTAQDDLYCVTYSSGTREMNYALDGVKNEMEDFGILTLSRLNGNPLATGTYTYIITIDGEQYTGHLESSEVDNSYSTDVGVRVTDDAVINVQISFTGYNFSSDLTNVSSSFAVDGSTALNIANEELSESLTNILDDGAQIETVMKIVKDSSSESSSSYWYIGVVSNNGDTLGILIDANSGEIIAKKV